MVTDLLVRTPVLSKVFRKIAFYNNNSFFYWERAEYLYKEMTGYWPEYKQPKLLSDKLMWLTRYYQQTEKTICADKYKVRDYIAKKGLSSILIPLIGVYDNPEEIEYDTLPNQYVLKCNHGSGYNIIVLDKSKNNIAYTNEQLKSWMNTDYYNCFCEIHYKNIERKIICEELLSQTAPTEYQCWCINGEPDSLLVCRKNFDGSYDAGSFSTDFKQLYDRYDEKKADGILERPKCLDEILEYSRILSKDFPFVRADFYEVEGKVYFAEITFTPNGNYLTKYKPDFHERLGKKLILPQSKII